MTLKRLFFSYRTVAFAVSVTIIGSAQAGFQYTARDVLFGFRSGGPSELVVNGGQVSTYYSLSIGQEITVASVTTAQLSTAFSDLNNVSFSVSADVRTVGDVNYPFNTLWVIAPRSDINTQTTPWKREGQSAQGDTGGKIDGIAGGAVSYGTNPDGPNNTSTGVIIPSDDPSERQYSHFMGSIGDYGGTFPGVAELTTPSDFDTAGQVVRADFYELKPSSIIGVDGTYLGYFEFSPSGVMKFHRGPSSSVTVPRPNITAIQRTGTQSTITFTTVAGGTYTLRYTDSAGLSTPVSTWATGGTIAGDGTNKSLNDTTSGTERFYAISAH